MQYPLISEYVAAIREAEGNLDSLSNLRPVLDSHGEPFRSSGAFAIVFKMKDPQSGKCFALKCFTEEQAGRAEAYRLIAEELESVDSPYLTSVRYLEKELFVDCNCGESEFPVLVMDWVDGKTMEAYIAEHYADSDCMAMLCFRFAKMAAWLRAQPFAHGDIKPDNILVKADGSLTLVDYDGMFIPAMKGQPSPTMGTRDFSHPLRKADDFDETIDDFSLASILLSLKAIALCPRLYEEYAAADRLLFSATDYLDLSQCKAMAALHGLMADGELNRLLALFLLAHAQKNLAATSFRLFNMAKPKIEEKLSTNVTDEDRNEAIEDSFGAKYSKDGKRLLKVPYGLKGEYSIREGTKVVCDRAFSGCSGLTSIHIPDGVTSIGKSAFSGCSGLTSIHIPDGVTSIGKSAFSGCRGLTSIHIPDGVTSIGYRAFEKCSGLTSIHIPDGVTSIGDSAFDGCSGLTSIHLGSRVKEMGANPFGGVICNIENHSPYFEVEDQVLYTKGKKQLIAFLSSADHFEIPDGVTSIGNRAFFGCSGLTNIHIPDGVTSIGDCAFFGCSGLTNIHIPDGVTSIGAGAFYECSGLTSIHIPDGVTSIGAGAFSWCSGLKSIFIPKGTYDKFSKMLPNFKDKLVEK